MSSVLEDVIMVNQINDSSGTKHIDSRLNPRNQDTKSSTEQTASPDSVSFSDISQQLNALKESLKSVPEVDQTRVSHFKAMISSGDYQIDSTQIASKMLGVA